MSVDVENQRVNISDLPQPPSLAPDSSTRSGRSGRAVRFPRRFDDFVPVAPTPLAHIPNITRAPGVADATLTLPPSPSAEQSHPSTSTPEPPKPIVTKPNGFGLFRRYTTQPTVDPESAFSLDSVCDTPTLAQTDQTAASRGPETNSGINGLKDSFFPFSNYSSAKIAGWHYSGSSDKSIGETNRLVEALRDPRFDVKELAKFNLNQENERLDHYLNDIDNPFSGEDGWLKTSVKIRLPKTGKKFPSESAAPQFEVKEIYHRRLVNIIKGTLSDPVARMFHMTPFEQFWVTDDGKCERVYSEIYSSDAMLEAHKEVCALPHEPGDDLEHVVIPLMAWSNSTHLASFGDASLWPIYISFRNQSKYVRGKPTSHACHHLAYIPSVCFYARDTLFSAQFCPAS